MERIDCGKLPRFICDGPVPARVPTEEIIMPIYDYQFEACGHQLEAMQKMSDAPLTDCPECGKPDLKKMLSAAGFRLKGSGWYETDFKSGSKKNVADSCSNGSGGHSCGGGSCPSCG